METRQLEAFITVVDIGSFTRAAARLRVSQPTITSRIKTLEQELETRLLERLPGGIQPTATGLDLLPYAREIVALVGQARNAVTSEGQPHGRVEVGTIGSLTSHRLLPMVEYLYLRYPKVQVSIRPLQGDAICDVRDRRLDCAIFVDTIRECDDVAVRVLCPEPLALVSAPRHPLLNRTSVASEELRQATLVCWEKNTEYHSQLENIMTGADGTTCPRLCELDSIEAVKRSVANGIGVALMPWIAAAHELAQGELGQINWTPPFATYTQIAWRPVSGNRALDVLVDAAVQAVEEQSLEESREADRQQPTRVPAAVAARR